MDELFFCGPKIMKKGLLRSNKRVLLIFPFYSLEEEFKGLSKVGNMLPPLGLAYVGAALEEAGYEVKIIDASPLGWKIDQVVAVVKDFDPDYIGISASTVSFNGIVKLAKLLKKSVLVPIIIGGPHVTALPDEAMSYNCFDVGVIGEGEETIVELLAAIDKKTSLRRVKGVIFRDKGKLVTTTPRPYIADLDKLPYPARHLMPSLATYHPTPATYKKFPVGTMITSRGCPNRCSFCFRGVFGNRWRFHSPEKVVEEMELLVNKHKAAEIRIWDDTFNVDPKRVKEICRLIIKRGLKVSWTCLGRVNRVDVSMLRLMKKAGCWQISYGIESGSDEILKSINKGITKKMVQEAVNLTYKTGIKSLGFFILGLPGESAQTMEETIAFAKSLPLDAANFTIATPYPGTELWELAKKTGALKNISYDQLLVNLPETAYFIPEGMSVQDVKEYEKKAYRQFYRNPSFFLRQLRSIESLPELGRKMQAFFQIQSI